MKANWLKIVGVVAIIGGGVALAVAGVNKEIVVGIVAGVFVLAGAVSLVFIPKKK